MNYYLYLAKSYSKEYNTNVIVWKEWEGENYEKNPVIATRLSDGSFYVIRSPSLCICIG